MSELPQWPDPNNFAHECADEDVIFDHEGYQRALAAAWEARCRLAVATLKVYSRNERYGLNAHQAMLTIGELP